MPEERQSAAEHGMATVQRGAVQMLAARVVLLVSGFGVSVILARVLGPVEFGIYGVVMSLLVWFERVIGSGVPRGAMTMLARDDGQRGVIEQSVRVLLAAITLPLFGVAWIFAPELAAALDIPNGAHVLRVAALNLPVMALFFVYDNVLNGLRLFAQQSQLQIVQAVLKLAGIALLLLAGLSVTSAFGVHVAATVVTVAWVALRHPVARGRPSWPVMREMVVLGVPLGIYLVALLLVMNLSVWQLQVSSGDNPAEVGYYVAALNLTRIMMMVPSSVSGVLYAALTAATNGGHRELAAQYIQHAVRFATILIVPACVLLAVNASGVMVLLFGDDYAAGGRTLALLCVAFGMVAVMDVLLNAVMASGGLARAVWVLLALIPLLFTLNVHGIHVAGAAGAAAASAVVLTIGAVVSLVITYRTFGAPLRGVTVLRVAVAGAAVGLISWLIPSAELWLVVELGLLGMVYLALLWFTGELTVQDARPFALWKTRQG